MFGGDGSSHPGSVVLNALIDIIGGLFTKVAQAGKDQLGVSADGQPDELTKTGLDEQNNGGLSQEEKAKAEERLKMDAEHNTSAQLNADRKANEAMQNEVSTAEKSSIVDKVTSSVKSAFKW